MRNRLKMVLLVGASLSMLACGSPALQHIEQGDAYCKQERWDEAIADYGKAVELDPTVDVAAKLAEAYANRAKAHTTLGMETEAEQDFNRAIELGFPSDILKREIERLKKLRQPRQSHPVTMKYMTSLSPQICYLLVKVTMFVVKSTYI